MTSTFFGLNIARRGMSAHKTALDVTAHNIANASTQGYSRQQAIFGATTPYNSASGNMAVGAGQIGTGVQIDEVRRVRDSFLDYQIRPQLSKLGYWDESYGSLTNVEALMMEPTETGLSNVFESFWGAWQELAKNPTSGTTRSLVLESSVTLASSLNGIARQLETIVGDLNVKVDMSVRDINSISVQVAGLNKQIVANVGAGLNPNDLMDQRDLLLDQLAELVDFTPVLQSNGSMDVSVGGRYLVQDNRSTLIKTQMVDGHMQAQWADGTELLSTSGRMAGIDAVRDWVGSEFYAKLNEMTVTLMDKVNELHADGLPLVEGGAVQDFFVYSPSVPADGDESQWALKFIMVNPILQDNPSLIRAAADNGDDNLGQGENALAIARLRNTPLFNGETISIEGFYSGIINSLGVESQQAERAVLNQEALSAQLVGRREEASGVSIDEELSNMVQFQHGYQAAARLLTTLDEVLQTLINLGR